VTFACAGSIEGSEAGVSVVREGDSKVGVDDGAIMVVIPLCVRKRFARGASMPWGEVLGFVPSATPMPRFLPHPGEIACSLVSFAVGVPSATSCCVRCRAALKINAA